jgi:hypothetical protein
MSNDDIANIAKSTLDQAGVHSIKIKDRVYTIELLKATEAFAVATQLLKVALPAIGAWVDGSRKEGLVLPEENEMFAGVGLLLVGQLDKISVLDIVTLLTQKIKKNGNDVDVDTEFKGDLGGFVALLEFVLKENCGSFFIDYLQTKGITLPSLKMEATRQEGTPSQ